MHLIETSVLCRAWLPQIPRKGDRLSPKSAQDALISNGNREDYGCHPTKPEAKEGNFT